MKSKKLEELTPDKKIRPDQKEFEIPVEQRRGSYQYLQSKYKIQRRGSNGK